LIFPYQIVFTYGNGEIEFFEWENKPDDYYEQNEGQDKYWNKPDWAKFKSIFRAPMQNKKVYVFNSYTYHTLHSNEKTRVAVWIPKIKTLEECKQYCEYLESL
jgi:hypothetical protein